MPKGLILKSGICAVTGAQRPSPAGVSDLPGYWDSRWHLKEFGMENLSQWEDRSGELLGLFLLGWAGSLWHYCSFCVLRPYMAPVCPDRTAKGDSGSMYQQWRHWPQLLQCTSGVLIWIVSIICTEKLMFPGEIFDHIFTVSDGVCSVLTRSVAEWHTPQLSA